MALNPAAPLEVLEEVRSVLDFVLVMAVNPGFSGQQVVPDHFGKLERIMALLHRWGMDIDVFVDGNKTHQNAKKMYGAGANGFIVGTSSLLKDVNYFKEHYYSYIENIIGIPNNI